MIFTSGLIGYPGKSGGGRVRRTRHCAVRERRFAARGQHKGRPLSGAPAPDGTCIEVDEVGSTIIADTATPERDGRVSDGSGRKVGEANIDGLAGQVQAIFCDAAGGLPEHLVRARRAVSAEDVEAGVDIAEVDLDVVKEIEQLRIDRDLIAGAEITEEVIDLMQRAALVAIPDAVGDRNALVGMEMAECENAWTFSRFFCKSRCGDSRQGNA